MAMSKKVGLLILVLGGAGVALWRWRRAVEAARERENQTSGLSSWADDGGANLGGPHAPIR